MTNAANVPGRSFWVVVADESKAIIYSRETRHGPMQELFSLENEAARAKTAELLSDRGGRSFDSAGKGRHTMAKEKSSPKRHLAETFAKQIAERIGKASHVGSCIAYSLIAAPRFLGLLRDALANTAAQDPLQTVSKEVVGQDTTFIEKLLE